MNNPSVVEPQTKLDTNPSAESPVEESFVGNSLLEEELLVEEISIDGMCGVY